MTMNRVDIVGRLGAEPELRQTASGMQVMSIRVAVSEYRRNKQTGQSEERVHWVGCSMFGDRAANVSQMIHKGDKVAIAGKLNYSEWEDRNGGGKRSKLEVLIDDIEFMSRQQGQQQYAQQAPQQMPQPAPQYAQPAPQYQAPQPVQQPVQQAMPMPEAATMYDSDIPF